MKAARVLTVNGGSSSIKVALFDGDPPARRLAAAIERIGRGDAVLTVKGEPPERQPIDASDHAAAAGYLIDWLDRRGMLAGLGAIGHRVVHGGPRYTEPQRVTPELIAELRRLSSIDPDHLPGEIALIEAFGRQLPDVPQIACFDTAFHAMLPRVAQLLPLPRRYDAAGVRRYGFHGLSYAYLMDELVRVAGREAAGGRVILAHLGAGASMAAIHEGKSVDTTMAFTPTAGLVMATRTGDLDPGVLVYLLRSEKLSADQLDDLLNKQSGLLGVSESSPDMRDLLAWQAIDVRAAEAVDLFCYQARKWVGALAAVLGGLDTLVFSGGIGENAAEVRQRICDGLGFLGVHLDAARNAAGAAVISADGTPATVRIIPTDEEVMIAQLVQRMAG